MLNKQGYIMVFVLLIILILISIYSFVLKPKFTTYKNAPPLKLIGTSWKDEGIVAIINGKVLKEGDNIEGYRIIKIEKNSVILSYNKQKFKLTFNGLTSSFNIKDAIRCWLVEVRKYFKQIQNKISSLVPKVKEQVR